MNPKNSLYSQIIVNGHNLPESKKVIFDDILGAHVFFIDNVAEYFYEISDQEYWDLNNDFPNIAPPLNTMWFEWKGTELINSNGAIKSTQNFAKLKLAALVKAFTNKDNGWLLFFLPFASDNNSESVKIMNFIFMIEVSKNGQYIDDTFKVATTSSNSYEQENDRSGAEGWLFPIAMALSFIHCRNVQIIPKGKGVHHNGRDRNAPTFRYHVLQIEPMKKVLAEKAEKNNTDIKMAVHICRGHFKDYRNGNGLFGKFKDVYWWDQQLRGDFSLGYVDKDYIAPNKKGSS